MPDDDTLEQILKMLHPPEDGGEIVSGPVREMQVELRRLLQTHEHWVIVSYDEHSNRVMKDIEDHFYKGKEANADFTLFISVDRENPFVQVLGLALAHKRRMTMGELGMYVQEQSSGCDNPDHDHRLRGMERGDLDATPVLFPVQLDPSPLERLRSGMAQAWAAHLMGEDAL